MYTILLAEDNALNREMLSRRLEKRGYRVVQAVNGEEAVAKTRAANPDLILMDLSMPVLDGWGATRKLKAEPATRQIPVIALTAHAIVGDKEKAIEAGCDDFETKPVDLPSLLAKIEAYRSRSTHSSPAIVAVSAPQPSPSLPVDAPPPATLLVVDDNDLIREILSRRLQKLGYQVVAASRGREALEHIDRQTVDLVLLDLMMPEMSGMEVLAAIRKSHSMVELPVVMVTAKGEGQDMGLALAQGANDYVSKPVDFPLVVARIQNLLAARQSRKTNTPKPDAAALATERHGRSVEGHRPSLTRSSAPPGKMTGEAAPARPLPAVGQVLGKCLLMEKIGHGGGGLVYRALHTSLKITVVVKILQPEMWTRDPHSYESFKTEARALAQLNHPNIVRIMDFEDDPSFPYVVLEHIQGSSLAEMIEQSGQVRLDRMLQILAQVIAGLSAAHGIGIVHRGVKPSNVLLTRNGDAKVADLGLTFPGKTASFGADAAVAYLAPEQTRTTSPVDLRADIHALGATFYHALTGRLPFPGRSRTEVIALQTQGGPVPPHELVSSLNPAVSKVVLGMMARHPDDRYQTYEELQTDLADLSDQVAKHKAIASPEVGTADGTMSRTTKTAMSLRALRDKLAGLT